MAEKAHRKLVLWDRATNLVVSVYEVTRRFPASERFGLASQMQRAAVSIPCNIAEGAARKGRKEYLHFLYVARSSASELDTQLERLPGACAWWLRRTTTACRPNWTESARC